jgi:hypothetical protein
MRPQPSSRKSLFLPHQCDLRHVVRNPGLRCVSPFPVLPTMKIVNQEEETSSSTQRFKVAVVQVAPSRSTVSGR